jgi:hypothetical protein
MTSFDRIVYTTLRMAFHKLTDDLDEDSDEYRNITIATEEAFKEITNHDGIFKHTITKKSEKQAPVVKQKAKASINWQDIDDEYEYTADISLGNGYYPVKKKKDNIVSFAMNDEGTTRWIDIDDSKLLRANKVSCKVS